MSGRLLVGKIDLGMLWRLVAAARSSTCWCGAWAAGHEALREAGSRPKARTLRPWRAGVSRFPVQRWPGSAGRSPAWRFARSSRSASSFRQILAWAGTRSSGSLRTISINPCRPNRPMGAISRTRPWARGWVGERLPVGLHGCGRRQLHLVAELGQPAAPMVRRGAGLAPAPARRQRLEERDPLRPRELPLHDDPALSIDAMDLKHRLGDIQARRDDLPWRSSLSAAIAVRRVTRSRPRHEQRTSGSVRKADVPPGSPPKATAMRTAPWAHLAQSIAAADLKCSIGPFGAVSMASATLSGFVAVQRDSASRSDAQAAA